MVVLGVGLLVALIVVRGGATGGRLATGAALMGAAAGTALWPVRGQPPVTWLPVLSGWVLRAPRRRRLNPAPLAGACAGQRWQRSSLEGTGGGVAGITVAPARQRPGDDPLGVILDRSNGARAAVISVPGQSFGLLDPDEKRRRLAAWGRVLATAGRAGSPVHRVQWIEMAWPGSPAALRARLEGAPRRHDGPGRSYRELIEDAGPASQEHHAFIVVAVHPRKVGASLRPVPSREEAITDHLRREVRLLSGQLSGAEIAGAVPLGANDVVAILRAAGAGAPALVRREEARQPGGVERWPRVMATQERWAFFRTNGSLHVTYWISEWPRLEVGPDFLAPLISAGGTRRLGLTMAPIDPHRALRQATSDRTADLADEELRRRAGFVPSARRSRAAEGVVRREAELADGHADYRFSGYVTVSATSVDELDQRCAEIEQAAQHAHLELVRLWGRQEEAWSWTLPLGRGLA